MITAIRRVIQSDVSKILVILGLAFCMTYFPHHNYPYPIHGDEWVHLAYSNALLQAGSTIFNDPFYGESGLDPEVYGVEYDLESGFHLFWVIFQLVSGISWLTIFRYFPSIIFVITVLTVYIFTKKEGFGWEAAFLTCLIPTTVGILGPAFLVPLAMGLLFVPLMFYIMFNFQTWHSYLILCVIFFFLIIMHPPSAVIIFTILIPFILLNLRRTFKHSLGMALALVIPFAASLPWTLNILVPTMKDLLTVQASVSYTDIPLLIQTYGYLPIACSSLGIIFLLIKGGKKNQGLFFGLVALLILLLIFSRLHYGLPILYKRGLVYLILMLSIFAGAGLAWVRTISFTSKPANVVKSFFARNAGGILCLVIICVVLAIGIPSRQQTDYYHQINDEDYQAFIWIRDNLDQRYEKAILDPWKATAFTAITQKYVYTRVHSVLKSSDRKAYDFLGDGCTDTSFLRENEISIVYSKHDCNNPDLIEVWNNVYVLRDIEGK